MTTNPSSRYACDHARMYGSWRSQLMHVQVQKFTRTTRPRSSAGPSGSELSHAVAPPSEGRCTCASTAIYPSDRVAATAGGRAVTAAADSGTGAARRERMLRMERTSR